MEIEERSYDEMQQEISFLRQQIHRLENDHLALSEVRVELEEVKSSLERAQRIAHLGNWDWNIVADTLYWSDEIYRIFGLRPQGFGATYEAFLDHVHPDDKDRVERAVFSALYDGETYEIDHRIVRPDGEVRVIHERGEVTYSASRKPVRMIGTVQDVTEVRAKERELHDAIENLRRSNTELERFAYVASHDLQEPLRMVASYLQLLEARYGDQFDGEGKEFIDFAVDGAHRMKGLINDLLEFSRVQTRGHPFKHKDLNKVVDDALRMLQMTIEESAAKITVGNLPAVCVDEGQMQQVFQNLIHNALKYSGDGRPEIDIGALRMDREWYIFVRDNGIGIDPKYHDKIFVLFQRLDPNGIRSGTGVGLAIAKRVVLRHNGRIWVDSSPGEGSTFFIALPADECPNRGECGSGCQKAVE